MVKVTSSDLLAILRRFDVALENSVPRHIEQIKFSNPSTTNTMVSFRFNKNRYCVLFDDVAEDDANFILQQFQTETNDLKGKIVENPNDHMTTYGLPFKGKDVYLFAVLSDKKRLDVELAHRYPDTTRSTWQKHIKAGSVSVNGEVQTSPKTLITENDLLAVDIPERADFKASELPIIYIDDNVVVINKPVGVLSHSKGALNDEFTVAEFFRRYTAYNLDTNRPGIIHRLDRDTSGIMIGARNEETATMLQKQFADRKTKKTYIAVVDGLPKSHAAKIDLPIGRNPSAPSTFRVDAKGKTAQTNYEVLETNEKHSLLLLTPYTGRTHQLRVHTAYIGTPIHGDKVYGKPADRMYLHAYKLEITIPTGDRRTFVAPVPSDFTSKFDFKTAL